MRFALFIVPLAATSKAHSSRKTRHVRSLYGQATLAVVAALWLQAGCQSREGDPGSPGTLTQGSEPNTATAPGPEQTVPAPATSASPTSPEAGSPNAVPQVAVAVNPNLRFVGRLDTSSDAGPIFAWPGVQIIAGFSGTSLTLNIKAIDQQVYYGIGNVDNYLDVTIDANPSSVVRVPQGVTSFQLASGLAAGNHTVVITKRTESQIGSLQFLGFTLDAGATLVPGPAARTRHIEVIGDSGTVGYGADGNYWANRCKFTPATENVLVTYGAVAANILNADLHVTGGSGKGIYQNRDTTNDSYYTLPVMWTLTSADTYAQPSNKANINWNPNQWLADAVVVIIGGNDFAASTPPAAAYNKTAVQFLTALRAAYPNAHVFVAISPMLDPPVAGESTASDSEIAISYGKAAVNAMADPKVHYLPLALDDGSRGYGCDYHMNAASHKITGQVIAAAIAANLGW